MAPSAAASAAQKAGHTNVKVTDKIWFLSQLRGCGKDDVVAFKVTGTNAQGQEVDMTVCMGWFKGSTIRY